MSLAESRKQLSKALAAKLPRRIWAHFPDARTLDAITKPTLQLVRTKVQPSPAAPRSGVRLSTFSLQVIAPENASDDQLEDWLEEVLAALDEVTDIIWTEAERGVWPATEATNPAYSIPFTRNTTKES